MNNPLVMTAVCWETRNYRHARQAVEWCRNYGLQPLTKTTYIGRLRQKERAALEENFAGIFTNKTEKFLVLPLCKTCFSEALLINTNHGDLETPSFEIVNPGG